MRKLKKIDQRAGEKYTPYRYRSFGNKVKIGNKVQFGDRFKNWCNVWSVKDVTVDDHVPECHVTFGRWGLHNVWWDPQIHP